LKYDKTTNEKKKNKGVENNIVTQLFKPILKALKLPPRLIEYKLEANPNCKSNLGLQ
jgi:hypothetical protein